MYAHERLLSRTMNFLTIKSKRKEISTPLFNLFVTNHDYVKSRMLLRRLYCACYVHMCVIGLCVVVEGTPYTKPLGVDWEQSL